MAGFFSSSSGSRRSGHGEAGEHERILEVLEEIQMSQKEMAGAQRRIEHSIERMTRPGCWGQGEERPEAASAHAVGRASKRKATLSYNAMAHLPSSQQDLGSILPLPAGWPATLAPREGLLYNVRAARRNFFSHGATRGLDMVHSSAIAGSESEERPAETACCPRALDPNSSTRAIFDVCGIVVAAYELTATPYLVAWGVPLQGSLKVCAGATLLFWALDIAMSFATGFYNEEGELELGFPAIARRYTCGCTYFFLDFGLVASELITLSLDGYGQAVRYMILMRVLRMLRMLRFVRLLRILKSVIDRRRSDRVKLVAHGLTFCVGLLWVAHVLSCCWYAIGRLAPSDTGGHWAHVLDHGGQEPSRFYEYLTAYHFSLQQLAAGAMDVPPTNSAERQFNIICLLLGWLFGSSIVATLSTAMMEIQMAWRDRTLNLEMLAQFLEQNRVKPEMSIRLQNYVTEKISREQRLAEEKVPYLNLLSPALRAQLHEQMYQPHLFRYPLFRVWSSVNHLAVRALATHAVRHVTCVADDIVFEAGVDADDAFLLLGGNFRYVQKPDTSKVTEHTEIALDADGQCLCEVALWSNWVHVGTCEAVTDCAILAIEVRAFVQTVGAHRRVADITLEYGRLFFQRLQSAEPPEVPWPTDVSVPLTEYSELVMSMDHGYRNVVGTAALKAYDALQRGLFASRKGFAELKEELVNGTSTLLQMGDGEVVRIVAVAVLRLQNADGKVFSHIGLLDGDNIIADCKLPGSKLQRGEDMSEAFERLLDKMMEPLVAGVQLQRQEVTVTWETSRTFGIRTKYLRTTSFANLDASFHIPTDSVLCKMVKLPGRDVYVIQHKWQSLLYTWLSEQDLERWSSGAGKPELEAVMDSIRTLIFASPHSEAGGLEDPLL